MWVLSQNGVWGRRGSSEMETLGFLFLGFSLLLFFNMPCDSVAFNRAELQTNLISEASEP